MEYLFEGLKQALKIISSLDEHFLSAVFVSLKVSFSSITLAALVGVPFAVFLAKKEFFGREVIFTILNTLMSIPTVVIGLMVYSFISRVGPLGNIGMLYTPFAIMIGQFILVLPIICALTISSIKSLDKRIFDTIASLGANFTQGFCMFLHEARFGICAAIIAGFGRVFGEIGISMMLGGNIKGYTRNITTTIALETSKGEFALGLALGIVLLTIAFSVNILFTYFQKRAQ